MNIRQFFFKNRSYTPLFPIAAMLILAKPTWTSFLAGLIIALAGEGFRFWGVLYAGSATRTTGRVGGGRLITDGPYGYVRNPLYVGNFILSFGLVIMSWAWMPWMVFVYVSLFGIQYSLIVDLEEEYLKNRFGTVYEDYRHHVRRWIPRVRPYASPEKSDPKFLKALHSERNTLQAIVAVCGLLLIRWHFL